MTPDINLHHHLFETTLQKQFFLLAASLKKDKNQFKHANIFSSCYILRSTFNYHHVEIFSDIYTNAVRITGIHENVQNDLFQKNCLRTLKSVKPCLRFALALLLES